MAMALRSHRTLSRICRSLAAISPSSSSSSSSFSSGQSPAPPPQKWSLLLHSRASRSSPFLQSRPLSSSASLEPSHNWSYEDFKPRELGVDEIEGCDFNHWLIVMDFPKGPKPSPEEMVRSFEETCAKALDVSEEEAKKKIYACSTSNYTGFHVEVTEADSEKFNGQPGVVFVLPDSYVDPEKKEYGGDKYINGVIIPRPRPTLNGRCKRDQPKHDQQGGPTADQQGILSYSHERTTQRGLKPNQQRNPSNGHQGPTLQSYPPKQNNGLPGVEVYVPQESYDRPTFGERRDPQNYSFDRNYNPVGQGHRRDFVPTVAPGERNFYQQGNGYPGNYNQMEPGNIYAREQRGSPQGDQRNYAAPRQQGGFMEDYRYYGPPHSSPYGQGVGGCQVQGTPEDYWHGANSDIVEHGTSFGYGQGYPRHIQGQSFSQHIQGQSFSQQEQRNVQGASYYPQEQREFVQGYQRNYAYAPPPRCERCFREYYPNYGPPQGMPYGHRIGGYQVQGAPESYWQGTSFGYGQGYPGHIQGQGFPQEQPRNMQGDHYYSQEPREFRHANYAPPKRHEGFGEYQNYGPGQGTPSEQGLGEYQGHGTPVAHWQGRKY